MKTYTQTKHLFEILPKRSGRDSSGHISVRHQGGRHKRFYRYIDFKRDKGGVPASVMSIEYDPNRSAKVALLNYADGEKRYILAPMGLKVGETLMSGKDAEVKIGNALPLKQIPIGTQVHSLELTPGKGAKIVRSAGVAAMVLAKEDAFVHIKLPSGEIRRIVSGSLGTIGQVSNEERRTQILGTAGAARRRGKRPEVRGVAQNPRTHPHGGGEGRSGIGMKSPKTPWGKRALGVKTRRPGKYSNKQIVERRK
ncbi:MAG: 50S ribosomal protein L2 [Patescibacteria group bacterium]